MAELTKKQKNGFVPTVVFNMAIKVKKNLTDEEIKNIIEPELTKRLEEQRLVGVQIGWLACCKTVLKKIEEGLYQEAIRGWLKKEVEKLNEAINSSVTDDK